MVFFRRRRVFPWSASPGGAAVQQPLSRGDTPSFGEQPMDDRITWFPAGPGKEVRGVALVIHGLNLQPAKMGGIIHVLNRGGVDVLNLSLSGHGTGSGNGEEKKSETARLREFKRVSFQKWMEETYHAFRRTKERSEQLDLPLFLVGYSLGGLLGTTLFASRLDVSFQKMVLLAPAFTLHPFNHLVRLLSPFPGFVVVGASCGSYCANRGTPMAAYNSLFDAMNHLEKNMGPRIDVPTLIFMDRYDELVSYSGLRRMIEERELGRWRFHLLKKGGAGEGSLRERMRHLIIDEATVGSEMWEEMGRTMISHLVG